MVGLVNSSVSGSGYVPPPIAREKTTVCKRTCCWTPFGHSAAAGACACHRSAPARKAA